MPRRRNDNSSSRGDQSVYYADTLPQSADNKPRSSLISALGEGAVSDRVKNRVLNRNMQRSADNDALAYGEEFDILGPTGARIEQIFSALVSRDHGFFELLTSKLHRDDVPFSAFYRQVAVPLANRLGDAWSDDQLSMVDVEFATSRLALLCDQYAHDDHSSANARGRHRRVLLARTPGEKHTLGLSIVAKCYAHSGWQVDGGPLLETGNDLLSAVRDTRYQIVGISVGSQLVVDTCRRLIEDVRQASSYDKLKIGLGGPGVISTPTLFDDVGADFVAVDALQAVEVSDKLVQGA